MVHVYCECEGYPGIAHDFEVCRRQREKLLDDVVTFRHQRDDLLAALETIERKLAWWLNRHPECADSYVSDSFTTACRAIGRAKAAG